MFLQRDSIVASVLGFCFCSMSWAGTMQSNDSTLSPFYLAAYGGYGSIVGAYKKDGDFAQGGVTMGVRPWHYGDWLLGAEISMQSGNFMSLNAESRIIEATQGYPVDVSLDSLFDFLLTVKAPLPTTAPLFVLLKGGAAYRQFDLDDIVSTSDNITQWNGVVEAGIGYQINPHVGLSAFYQGIYSGRQTGIGLDAQNKVIVTHIPTQQAVFLGVEYNF